MRSTLSAAAAAALLLAGCGEGGDAPANEAETANAATAAESAEDYQRRIEALGDAQRDAVFIRAIRDAGRDC